MPKRGRAIAEGPPVLRNDVLRNDVIRNDVLRND